MRKTLILFFFAFLTVNVSAQPEVEYTYDNAGNRIQRNIIVVGGMVQNNGDGTMQQSLEERLHIEDEGDILFNLYPNPTYADVDITIDYQNVPQQTVTMALYDVSGKLLENKQVSELRHHISLQNYPVGIYYLRIASLENKTMKEIKIVRR
jgi:hypothetical protein